MEISNTAALLQRAVRTADARAWGRRLLDGLFWSSGGRRWIAWDIYVGWLAAWSAFNLTPHGRQPHGLVVGLFFGLLLGAASWISGVPRPESNPSRYELLAVSLLATALGVVLCLVGSMGLAYVRIGRWVWVLFGALAYIGLLAPRVLVSGIESADRHRVLIYGAGKAGRGVLGELQHHFGIDIVGFLDDNRELWTRTLDGVPCLGGVHEAEAMCRRFGVHLISVAIPHALPEERAERLLRLRHAHIEILDIPELYQRFVARIPIDFITPNWMLGGAVFAQRSMTMLAKRLTDILFSLVGLLLTLPLWPGIALAIKASGPGPVFFRQWRMGYKHRPFRILKFRTMVTDAEKDGAQWARPDDARVTALGRWLRVTRLDEIPQLLNVLRGEMSMVGPRPERPEFIADIEKTIPYYDQRYLVAPGLTGWAQVRYRYGASMEDAKRKLEYDLYYLRNISFRLDLQILLRTVVMLMKGSR